MKYAVVLSGCGVYDGSEIHEAVMTMLVLDKNGCEYEMFAPDINQHSVINHLNGEPMKETRNVLIESARIARGRIKPLSDYKASAFIGIIFPGGFGVAKNLSTYATDGIKMTVNKDVARAVTETHNAGKVIGALCISPIVIAALVPGAEVTLGTNTAYNKEVKALGGKNTITANRQVIIDKKNKIVTTPCYMNDATITDIAEGANALVKAMMSF